jgi:hypothetical protein
MSVDYWPLHQPVSAHVAAFDIVGFSRNLTDPTGLLQDRNALIRAIEETALFASLSKDDFFAHFLGDELRLAIRGTALGGASQVLSFAEDVHQNLARFSQGECGTTARAVVLAGAVIARESLGCRYLSGPLADRVQRWIGSGHVAGGEIASDSPGAGWRPLAALGGGAFVRTVCLAPEPRAPPIDIGFPLDGRHCFLIAISPHAGFGGDTRSEELIRLLEDSLESAQVGREGVHVSVGPTAVMVALEDDTADRARGVLRSLGGTASRMAVTISAVLTKGPLSEVSRPWLSSTLTGGPPIVAARVLAGIPPGALAACGDDLELFFPEVRSFPQIHVPGKRGERFIASQAKDFFAPAVRGVVTTLPEEATRTSMSAPAAPANPLFDVYDPSCEPYFLERAVDNQVAALLDHSGVWISGPAGTGKTTSVRRALTRKGLRFAYIGFANCAGTTRNDILSHTFYEIASVLAPQELVNAPRAPEDVASRVTRMLAGSELDYLYIDELPTDDNEAHRNFTQVFSGLVVAHASQAPRSQLRYVVSSIHSPVDYVGPTQRLLFERVSPLRFSRWEGEDITRLLALLAPALPLKFRPEELRLILDAANGSPRLVKNCLRKLAFGAPGQWTVHSSVAESARELA